MLLSLATFCFVRQGVPEVSLTVTEANSPAVDLYRAEGFDSVHAFDATVWERSRIA
jgi:ribosomal protein S18 acetylase RimI-like enzyme